MKLKWSSFRAAFAGIGFLVRTQRHARWHLAASAIVVVAGVVCSLTRAEWLAIVPALGLVWVAEAINTAIEQACDAITTEHHPFLGHAKDVAAGAVLLAAFFAAVIGATVFLPHVWPW